MHSKSLKAITTIPLILFLLSCSNTRSSFDYDSSIDFSQLKTYQWDKQPSSAFSSNKPLVAKRIIKAIDDNMQRKALTASDSADINVSYTIAFEKKIKSGGLSAGIGMSVGKNNRGHINLNSGNQLRQTTEGTLIISMTSTKDNSLIWRSVTTKPLDKREATPDEAQKRISQLIYTMFEDYPPKTKK